MKYNFGEIIDKSKQNRMAINLIDGHSKFNLFEIKNAIYRLYF